MTCPNDDTLDAVIDAVDAADNLDRSAPGPMIHWAQSFVAHLHDDGWNITPAPDLKRGPNGGLSLEDGTPMPVEPDPPQTWVSAEAERLRAAGTRLHDAVNAAEQPPTPQQDMDIDSALEAWEALGEES